MNRTTTQSAGSDPGTAPANDLLWGIEAIACAINRTKRQTYHMASSGKLPVKKVGERYVASRSRLVEFLSGEAV